ncbi:MAG: methyltransferase domain-containing protein [Crenarchaeota archaeon]|nr:methyltransferase domain-containing protein [Thermoproteota archaeon]
MENNQVEDLCKRLQNLFRIDFEREPSTPLRVLPELLFSAYILQIVFSACEAKIFDLLKNPISLSDIGSKLGYDLKLLYLLLEILRKLGLVERLDDKYVNTIVADLYLTTDSPYSILTYVKFSRETLFSSRSWNNIVRGLRGEASQRDWSELDAIVTLEYSLAKGLFAKIARVLKELDELKRARKVLDIGCGTGLYSIYIARMYPHLEVHALDLPHVIDKVTRKVVEKFGLEDRVKLVPADFTKDDIGTGYDVVLDIGAVSPLQIDVLKKIWSSLNKDGTLISIHMLPDTIEDELQTLLTVLWEHIELGRRLTATVDELQRNFEHVGFSIRKIINIDREGTWKMVLAEKI